MSAVEDLSKALLAAVGENDENQGVTRYIDTGVPLLNQVISGKPDGGLPQGRLIEAFAPSSAGKTAVGTHFMAQAQRAGGVAGFHDHEKTFDLKLAKNVGLSDKFPFWIYKQPTTWEKSNMMIAKASQAIRQSGAISDDAPILFVLDSIASCNTESTIGKDLDELNMNDTTALARVTSTTLKSMAALAEMYNFSVLYLNQIRTKPGVSWGDPTTTPGGSSMEFYATTRLSLSRAKIMEAVKGGKEFVGQTITIKTVKNKLTRPFQEFKLDMMFEEDGVAYFDLTGALIDSAIALGNLVQAGSRIEWQGKSYYRKALIQHIEANGLHADLKALATPA
ncbi:hypothetical protein [Castellaniella sp.]|uniref:hypothetical protein n=1 Tax=Castellaniella sp. TaxID=1955812 RepID=UPI002B0029E4|nr:hypothetical protein [Castellaniella sp.]